MDDFRRVMMERVLEFFVGERVRGAGPVEVLGRLCAEGVGEVVMLHSAAGEGCSVIGLEPLMTVEVDAGGAVHLMGVDAEVERALRGKGVLEVLEGVVRSVGFEAGHGLVGWLGFIGYELGRMLEGVKAVAGEGLRWPVLRWSLYRRYFLYEGGEWRAVGVGGGVEGLEERLRRVVKLATDGEASSATVRHAQRGPQGPCALSMAPGESGRAGFCAKVERVKEYIGAGDIYQANIAEHWEVETDESGAEIFRRLCAGSAAAYAGYMRFVGADGILREVMSASPELFLEVGEGRVVTRPIKGTRRRDRADAGRDAALLAELVGSEKDKAELAMIVDLMRNDLGRVAEFGTVKVEAAREVEGHPTVWHTAATISAKLRAGAGLADLLRAVCPGGSITGAPKIRAMEIIEEVEGFRRGLYCGNIGVIGSRGRTMTLNIAIRTIVMQAGAAHVYAGGGIVADSEAEAEYEEAVVKAGAMLRALGVSDELPSPRSER